MSITGAEWKRFIAEGWPAGCVFAEGTTLNDGRDLYDRMNDLRIADDEVFEIPAWWRAWREGFATGHAARQAGVRGEGAWVVDLVAGWREGQEPEMLIVPMPKRATARAMPHITPRYGLTSSPP